MLNERDVNVLFESKYFDINVTRTAQGTMQVSKLPCGSATKTLNFNKVVIGTCSDTT